MMFRALLLLLISSLPAFAADTVADKAAQIIRKEKVEAIGWFVVGSHASGNIQPHSDIDILAIMPQLERSYRQTGLLGRQAYQVSVYGKDRLDAIYESERRNGNNVVMNQIAHGLVLKDDAAGTLATLQAEAKKLYASGPYPLPQPVRDAMCYRNKSWLQDFVDDRPKGESDAIAVSLYMGLADYYLRTNRQWTANGAKWLYRLLAQSNAGLADRFTSAYEAYFKTGAKQPLMDAAKEAMAAADCDIDNYRLVDMPVMNAPPAVR